MVAQAGEGPILLIKKLAGMILIVIGCLLTAVGLNSGSILQIALGVALLIGGMILIALKIIRRNQSGQLG
jgi:drug/metabolite transporter (DMT)-like permease